MSARSVALLALGVALTAGLTACDTDPAAPSAGGSTAPVVPSAAPTSPSPSPSRTTEPADEPAAKDNCPVDGATLLKALEVKSGHKVPKGQKLTGVQCYRDFAIAARETPQYDSDIQTFRFKAGAWKPFGGGSGGYCEGVPSDIKKHFQGVGYEGCS